MGFWFDLRTGGGSIFKPVGVKTAERIDALLNPLVNNDAAEILSSACDTQVYHGYPDSQFTEDEIWFSGLTFYKKYANKFTAGYKCYIYSLHEELFIFVARNSIEVVRRIRAAKETFNT